jgi:TolB-like protein
MQLRLLGGLDLSSADRSAQDLTRQRRVILACLALAGERGLTRAELCALFWPDSPSTQSRNSLRQALAAIRRALSDNPCDGVMSLESDLEVVKLSAKAGVIDVPAFRNGLKEGNRAGWIVAAAAYRGELLAGVELSEDVEQFVSFHRRGLSDQAQSLAERLSEAEDASDESLDAAQALAECVLQSTPASEEAHRALMHVHLRRGRTNAALRQFEQCEMALKRELRAEPDTKTRRLLQSIHLSRHGLQQEERADAGGTTKVNDAPNSASHPSVAIMPFDNLGEPSDEYFADGVVEEITSALSRIRDFFVIARQSTFTFKGRFVDVKEVGRELGVAYVVEGTVRRGGERLRISVQLIDASTRKQLWSERYEGARTEIFVLQDLIAAQVAGAMKPAVRQAEIEAATRKPPASLKAYDLVMRAFPKLWGQNASAIHEAIPILQNALHIDPAYGRAHALLAWCHALNATYLWVSEPEREVEAARGAVDAAAGRIDDDPTALTAAGAATGFCGDQESASALLEQALALDPNNAWAWARWGWTSIYRARPHEALERFEKAMKLSPLDPFAFNTRMGMASALACSGRPVDAVDIALDITRKHPDVTWANRLLAAWAGMAGNVKIARSAARKLLVANPDFTIRRYLAIPGFQDMPEYRDRLAEGLRAAGLPED